MSLLYAVTENAFSSTINTWKYPEWLRTLKQTWWKSSNSEKAALQKGDKCYLILPRSDFSMYTTSQFYTKLPFASLIWTFSRSISANLRKARNMDKIFPWCHHNQTQLANWSNHHVKYPKEANKYLSQASISFFRIVKGILYQMIMILFPVKCQWFR